MRTVLKTPRARVAAAEPRRLRRRALSVLLAVTALTAGVPAAQAGTARVLKVVPDPRENTAFAEVVYVAAPGEVNHVTVSFGAHAITLADPAGVTPGVGCVAAGRTRVRCSYRLRGGRTAGGATADLRLGDRDDAAKISGRYLGAPVGATLRGGGGDDRLTAGGGAVELVGGAGNDVLTGSPQDDTFRADRTSDGRDVMIGRRGEDTVSYSARGAGVRADLAGDRNDGAPGERDRIASDVEDLEGGGGGDRLSGNRAANRINGGGGADVLRGGAGPDALSADVGQTTSGRSADRLDGGAGSDALYGSDGPNRIVAGTGIDTVFAGNGNDVVLARDASLDVVECEGGRDLAVLDVHDYVSGQFSRCERVRRAGRPRAILFGTSTAGDPSVSVVGGRALPRLACPDDARRGCRGRASIAIAGRVVAHAAFRLRRGAIDFRGIPLTPATVTEVRARRRVRATLTLSAEGAGRPGRYAIVLAPGD